MSCILSKASKMACISDEQLLVIFGSFTIILFSPTTAAAPVQPSSVFHPSVYVNLVSVLSMRSDVYVFLNINAEDVGFEFLYLVSRRSIFKLCKVQST